MERIFMRREGRSTANPNPPEGYLVIGTHRTGGGGHRWYAYARPGLTLDEFIKFYKENPSLFGGWARFSEKGKHVIIETPSPGAWIGKKGRWVKALSKVLQRRVEIKPLDYFIRGRSTFFGYDFSKSYEIEPRSSVSKDERYNKVEVTLGKWLSKPGRQYRMLSGFLSGLKPLESEIIEDKIAAEIVSWVESSIVDSVGQGGAGDQRRTMHIFNSGFKDKFFSKIKNLAKEFIEKHDYKLIEE